MYKNADPGAEKDAVQIAERTAALFEQEIDRVIDKTYANRNWSVISLELRHIAIDEIRKIFSDKMLELIQLERNSEYRYKAQDELYPNLKEDLRKFYPSWAYGGETA